MSIPHGPRTGRPPTRAPRGVVSTPHYLATGAGLNVLQRGGSAVDAAIAANPVLCVTYPHMALSCLDGARHARPDSRAERRPPSRCPSSSRRRSLLIMRLIRR